MNPFRSRNPALCPLYSSNRNQNQNRNPRIPANTSPSQQQYAQAINLVPVVNNNIRYLQSYCFLNTNLSTGNNAGARDSKGNLLASNAQFCFNKASLGKVYPNVSGSNNVNYQVFLTPPLDPCPNDPYCEEFHTGSDGCCLTNQGLVVGDITTGQDINTICQNSSYQCYGCDTASGDNPVIRGPIEIPQKIGNQVSMITHTIYQCVSNPSRELTISNQMKTCGSNVPSSDCCGGVPSGGYVACTIQTDYVSKNGAITANLYDSQQQLVSNFSVLPGYSSTISLLPGETMQLSTNFPSTTCQYPNYSGTSIPCPSTPIASKNYEWTLSYGDLNQSSNSFIVSGSMGCCNYTQNPNSIICSLSTDFCSSFNSTIQGGYVNSSGTIKTVPPRIK